MRILAFSILALLQICPAAISQTADNLILQGRGFLTVRDITNANSRFKAATATSPNHQSANALYGATRLLSYVYTQPAQDMLDRLGVTLTNRNIYRWTAKPPSDTNGIPVPPNDFSASEAANFLRTNVLVQISGAGGNLAKVSDRNFILNLSSNETKIATVTIDYADIQMLRAMLHVAEFAIHYFSSLDTAAQLNALYQMRARNEFDIRHLLEGFPATLDYAQVGELREAQLAFQSAADRYLEASTIIRARRTDTVRLFNIDTNSVAGEAQFRENLLELLSSLKNTTPLTLPTNGVPNLRVNLGEFFKGRRSPRASLPEFVEGGILVGSLPDSTFGGVVFGLKERYVYEALSKHLELDLLPTFEVQAFPNLIFHGIDDRQYSLQSSRDLRNWTEFSVGRAAGGLVRASAPWTSAVGGQFFRAEDLTEYVRFGGAVVDGTTGMGLPSARVSSSVDGSTTTTDASGTFYLRTTRVGKTVGSYVLYVDAPGFGRTTVGGYYTTGNEAIGLRVQAFRPPSITRQPDGKTAQEGTQVSLTVSATATPPPTYRWLKNGVGTSKGTSESLSFAAVKLIDAGSYSVVVTSAGGSVTSRVATLTVTPKPTLPTITAQPMGATVRVGGRFTVSVVATGIPAPTYQWRKNGSLIAGATASSFQIGSVKASDAGFYTVYVSNSVGGIVSIEARLTVQ